MWRMTCQFCPSFPKKVSLLENVLFNLKKIVNSEEHTHPPMDG